MQNRNIAEKAAIDVIAELVPRFAEREPRHDHDGVFAAANIDDIRAAGLFALNVPSAAGGLGADLASTTEALRTLAHGSPSTALMIAMHTSVLAHYLLDPADVPASERRYFEEQRAWAWNEALDGKMFGVANSEPGAAGDVRNSRAVVSDHAGRLQLDGVKSFASSGLNADYFMAAAQDAGGVVEYYLVANDRESVAAISEWDATGMRSSESVTLRFKHAPVIGPLAYRGLLDGRNQRHWATLSFTSIFIGIAESMLEDAATDAGSLLQRAGMVELQVTLQACRGFLRHLTSRIDVQTAEYRAAVRDCKLFVTRSLAREGTALFTAQSGRAYSRRSPMSRKLRDLLAGPALRPPAGVAFDEVWEELGR